MAHNERCELKFLHGGGLAQERIANDVLSLSRIQLEVLSIQPVDFDVRIATAG